jgi:hypothetical protein
MNNIIYMRRNLGRNGCASKASGQRRRGSVIEGLGNTVILQPRLGLVPGAAAKVPGSLKVGNNNNSALRCRACAALRQLHY